MLVSGLTDGGGVCRHIAELIFYMEELRAHVRKYGPVMQRYYVQYLSGFDAVVLNEMVQVRTPAGVWTVLQTSSVHAACLHLQLTCSCRKTFIHQIASWLLY